MKTRLTISLKEKETADLLDELNDLDDKKPLGQYPVLEKLRQLLKEWK